MLQTFIVKLVASEDRASAIEYGLIAASICVVIIASLTSIFPTVNNALL